MRFHKLEEYLRTPFGSAMMGTGKGGADFAQCVRDAQKFYVGDVSFLKGVSPDLTEFPKLPYPMCVFELQDCDPKEVKRTVFLLSEELGYSDQSYNCIRIHSFCPYPMPGNADDLWMHSGFVDIDRETHLCRTVVNKATLQFLDEGPQLKRIADSGMLEESILASAYFLGDFLSILNCSNVEISEVAEPKFLNKKRLKSGKVPVYSYKTLVLKTRQQRLAVGVGTHDSPRIHLRRGHIKHRKTGDFWWQPCVVGDRKRGVVMKDYRVEMTC